MIAVDYILVFRSSNSAMPASSMRMSSEVDFGLVSGADDGAGTESFFRFSNNRSYAETALLSARLRARCPSLLRRAFSSGEG